MIRMPGITLDIRDSVTQAPLRNATLRFFSGGILVDSTQLNSGVYERAGLYDVTVERSGYATWRKDSILVMADECHVTTVRLVANMTRLQ